MLRVALIQRQKALQHACTSARALHASAKSQALSKFTMPAMSPTMTEGGLSAWKKKEGESFVAGDVLLEIETDKATMDVEAQDDGIIAKLLVGDGSKGVPVGTVIAIMGEEGDDIKGAEVDKLAKEGESEAPSSDDSMQGKEGTDVAAKASDKPQEKAAEEPESSPKKEEQPSQSEPKKDESSSSAQSGPREHIFATPIAKRMASERGIALKDVKGSGPNGRIIKSDIESYKTPAPAVKEAPSQPAVSGPGKTAPSAGAKKAPGTPSSPVTPATPYTDIPVSNMRKTIANRLSESKQTVPHYYVTSELNVDRLLKLREVFNTAAAKKAAAGGDVSSKGAAKLSVNDFIVKAAALALQEVPEANSAWLGENIRQFHRQDISVAVATPTGLITPIVTDAGGKGLATISANTKELAKKARDGKLKPEEYQGGTFTISNLGMFGSVTNFTAIINPPQSCILAIGGTTEKVVVDHDGDKGFKATQVIQVTLSADHRVVDGAVGARWMKAFKDLIENPLSFML